MLQLDFPSTWDITANNFSRRYFQMCFAGPSMGNSADADQISPDVSSLLNEVYLYPKLITGLKFYMFGDTTSLQFILKANLTEC